MSRGIWQKCLIIHNLYDHKSNCIKLDHNCCIKRHMHVSINFRTACHLNGLLNWNNRCNNINWNYLCSRKQDLLKYAHICMAIWNSETRYLKLFFIRKQTKPPFLTVPLPMSLALSAPLVPASTSYTKHIMFAYLLNFTNSWTVKCLTLYVIKSMNINSISYSTLKHSVIKLYTIWVIYHIRASCERKLKKLTSK